MTLDLRVLAIVRHAESFANARLHARGGGERAIVDAEDLEAREGQDPEGLSPFGWRQAAALAVALHSWRPSHVLCSPSPRVLQTIEPLSAALGWSTDAIETTPDLSEIALDLDWIQESLEEPDLEGRLLAAIGCRAGYAAEPIPGEDTAAFRARVRRAADRIRAIAPGRRLLVVAHWGVNLALVEELTGAVPTGPETRRNASITWLGSRPGGFQGVVPESSVTHLRPDLIREPS